MAQMEDRQGKRSDSLSHCKYLIFSASFKGTKHPRNLGNYENNKPVNNTYRRRNSYQRHRKCSQKNHSRKLQKSKERDEYPNRLIGQGEHRTEKTTK